MSNKSRTDTELMKIARTLADYDFIAIVELRDEAVLKRTQKILSQILRARHMITSSVLRLGVVSKSGVPSSIRKNASVLLDLENYIRIRRMVRTTSFVIRTGRPSVRASLIFQ